MKYTGSCHCGQIAFEVEGEIAEVASCNCSGVDLAALKVKDFNGRAP